MVGYICEHCEKWIDPEDYKSIELEISDCRDLNTRTESCIDGMRYKRGDPKHSRLVHYCGDCAEDYFCHWIGVSGEIDRIVYPFLIKKRDEADEKIKARKADAPLEHNEQSINNKEEE